jgi:hypothetical protein
MNCGHYQAERLVFSCIEFFEIIFSEIDLVDWWFCGIAMSRSMQPRAERWVLGRTDFLAHNNELSG